MKKNIAILLKKEVAVRILKFGECNIYYTVIYNHFLVLYFAPRTSYNFPPVDLPN